MQTGGCHPVDGCQDGDGFAGADFQFLAANVAYKDSGATIFPPFRIEHFNGVKVAVIGMTLEGTPEIVTPAGISNVNFADEAETVNALVPVLQRQGVETFVVLLHEGGFTSSASNGTGGTATKPEDTLVNKCESPTGPVPTIVAAMDDAVDVVMTGHTNWAVNCVLDGKIVTGAGQGGRVVTDVDLTVSRATKDVIAAKVNNVVVTRDVSKAPALTSLVDRYRTLSAPLANRVVGSISANISRSANTAGESALGDVIADSQLFATAPADLGGAQIAFMNPGGIRTDLNCTTVPVGYPCPVSYGQIFAVQPFGNSLVTMTLTGSQVERALEQQWRVAANGSPIINVLQVSEGFTYSWDSAAPFGSRVDPGTITLKGVLLDPAASYRVTVNSFLATGGDGFTVFNEGTDRLGGDVDLDAVEKYFLDQGTVSPGPQNRITRLA
jgi:5'-nucleotidase